MQNAILGNAIIQEVKKKKYKCPYCEQRVERAKLHIHIQNEHEDLIPEGYTALRVAFNTVNNKTEGHCIICKRVTDWNEDKGRYERLCDSPACHDAYKKMVADRYTRIYGTDRLQTDPKYAEEVQRKALEGRKISGKYKFADGGTISYMGTYEKKFLEFMDTVMHCNSEDIVAPGPSIRYIFEGKEHIYLPDFFYVPYNLIIEIKDGGSNPNNHAGIHDEARIKAKEEGVKRNGTFNYVRVTDNNYGQLLSCMSVCKYYMKHSHYYTEPVFRINESSLDEDMSGTIGAALPLTPAPIPHESDPSNYYVVQHLQNNVFNYGITKDPLQYTMYSVDPQAKGFYKVFKTDKGKIDRRYLTFKIKDKQSGKELYEQLQKIYETSTEFYDDHYDNYIYSKLTDGSEIPTPDQLLYDSRFELVKDPMTEIKESCDNLYKWLKADPITRLEEQVSLLEDKYTDELVSYNVLPDNIDNLVDLAAWKSRFDSMPINNKKHSDFLSLDVYGNSNQQRYYNKYATIVNDINPEDPIEHNKDSFSLKPIVSMLGESSSEEPVLNFEDNWEYKASKIRSAEKDGLIIMVDPEIPNYEEGYYSNETIAKLKEKYNRYLMLDTDKRTLSNQTASSILGIDNENLYKKILNNYLSRLDIKNINSQGISNRTDSSSSEIISTYSEIATLCNALKNTSNKEKRSLLKEQILNLGWNPEIPFNEEALNRMSSMIDYSSIQEIDATNILEAQEAIQNNKYTSEELKDKIVPVFVVLTHNIKLYSKAIMWFTDSDYSHASLSFDSSLEKMYTFTTGITNDPDKKHKTGFAIDTISRYENFDPHMKTKVYALFVTPEQKQRMQDAVQWFIDNKNKTKYAFNTILNIVKRRQSNAPSDGDVCKMVCSQFVYTILLLANFRLKYIKDPSLVSPGDIDMLSNDARFYVVYQGEIDRYNKKKVDQICYKILPALPLSMYGIIESSIVNFFDKL